MLGLWHYRADRFESDRRGVMQGDPPRLEYFPSLTVARPTPR
jgi:hypothetical protein